MLLGGGLVAAGPTAATPVSAGPAPAFTAATFADPPPTVRPKYRWWMPMAFTDDEQLRSELADMKAIGAGGAEVQTTTAAGPRAFDPDFLAEYGWGSPAWARKIETMAERADELDLALDFTISPRWPAIVPTVTDVNDPRASQQLVFSHAFVRGGTTYDGALPTNYRPRHPNGAKRTLVAALLARCADPACASQRGEPLMLHRDSVRDLTGEVGDDATLRVDVPGGAGDTYVLTGFFQTGDGQRRNNFTTTKPNYFLDHLSEQGVRATTEFYDSAILTPSVREALDGVGRVDLFEDSLELGESQKWTWDFAEEWERRRGYSPVSVLPALADGGSSGFTGAPFFDFTDGSGPRIRTDYRQTWNDLYLGARLDPLRQWANDRGMALRGQPYGGPIDTPEAATHVDVPEGESLVFHDSIEPYRLVSVGAHLNGTPVVSSECCAARESVWATTAGGAQRPGNLRSVYRGYAGGVTQVVWHGYPYLTKGEGSSDQTVWPGMSYGGNNSFSEGWGAKGGPNWADYRAINDHLARLQLVLRQGTPTFDVAVYLQDLGLRSPATRLTGPDALLESDSPLAERGYTHEYLSPAHLRLPSARVSDGRLFPEAGAYQAIVLADQTTMAVDTARRLLDLTRDGLPVVFVGDLPSATPGFHDPAARDAELRRVIARLVTRPTVHRVADLAAVPDLLARLGVTPAAAHATDSADVLSVRRSDEATDYYYLFNQRSWATEQRLTLTGDGRPYELDTWTGEITPLTDYRRTARGVVVDVALEPADMKVIALSIRRDDTFRPAPRTGHGPTVGRNHGLGPVPLDDWTLQVESWSRGESGLPGDTARTRLPATPLTAGDRGALPPWSAITPEKGYDVDLGDVSGIGTYRSTFALDGAWRDVRTAHLDLGAVVDTATVTVNGTRIPAIDPQDLRHVDVGDYLRPGENTLEVRVSSTLLNAVRVAPGTGAADRDRMAYGLLGPVRLTPVAARQPTLTVEPLERELPLAEGGVNRSRVRIANHSPRPVRVWVDAVSGHGIQAVPDRRNLRVPGRSSVTTAVRLSGGNGTGTSTLEIDVAASNGARGQAHVTLRHSGDLALNPTGSPYPRVWASSHQYQHPPSFLTDGQASSYWVSSGQTPGEAPTTERPEIIGVDFGQPTVVRAVSTSGRGNWAPRTYDVQASRDGKRWTTVGSEVDAPSAGHVTAVTPVRARYVRLRVTRGWYPSLPGHNIQLAEFAVHANPVTEPGGRR
ncbi:glycosyl hydrolase [Actinophytocola gossypii]|uniref:Discoidin domain-containing protein n=1 Tax=Actinophytocola gossypii TaxID=2812003 RepID=A0ABT2JAL7_9PSEU|nr:glycosyl hydrolase [Actinophytocola gossypii]MCT2584500.1 discoidin domain-containing protein [Actinophytocola gossypii]